jgi:hypothetical protein
MSTIVQLSVNRAAFDSGDLMVIISRDLRSQQKLTVRGKSGHNAVSPFLFGAVECLVRSLDNIVGFSQ